MATSGRADLVFIGGEGFGGQIAMAAAFQTQHVLGGVFCLDAGVPDTLYNTISSNEAGVIYPQYEAKKNMWICMTKNDKEKFNKELENKIGQQG